MNTADDWRDANPWTPMSRPIDLKHIGKLIEELGELQSALARSQIQGLDESEPVTGKINRKWIEDEIADVMANLELVCHHFGLIVSQARIDKKKRHLRQWHSILP